MKPNLYLDYAATTPLDPRVAEAMAPYLAQEFGNPSSIHRFGQKAEAALESSRDRIARVLGCDPQEIYFTSGGTESDNLALRGTALAARTRRGANHILVSAIEHPAVLRTAEDLSRNHNFEVEILPVDGVGKVDLKNLEGRIRSDTAIVSIMYANNEIGTINQVPEIGLLCKSLGVPFHTDAVQAAAYLPINVTQLNVDMVSLGAHKFYGPKGVGVLYVKKGTPISPVQTGGGQEGGMRAGTQNIPYIVGMAEALELANEERTMRQSQVLPMRDRIIGHVLEEIPESRLTGHPSARMPNHASFVFKDIDGNELLMVLDAAGYACSSGSACKTGNPEPSGVLLALGLSPNWALGSLRITLGSHTYPSEVDLFLSDLPGLVYRARNLRRNDI